MEEAVKKRVRQVTRALLGDIVPPPMTSPQGLASADVWITLESGETLKGYFHMNGYCYSIGNLRRPDAGVFRWKRDAALGGSADATWRDERPWVVSWSMDCPTTASALGSRKKFRLIQQTAHPQLLAYPPPTPTLPGSPSKKAPPAPRAAKRG